MKSHRIVGSHRLALTLVVLAFLAGCEGCLGCTTSPVDSPNSLLPRTCQTDPPLLEPQKLEILFVIDNSNSMIEEQTAVSRELTAFIDQIKQAGGVRQDFHVGVVTTSVYQHLIIGNTDWFREYPEQSGRLRPVPDVLDDGGVNTETNNERMLTGDDPELVAKFGRLVQQGVVGSGQETPFEAVRLALLSDLALKPMAQGGNQEFLRDGARLLVVVLSDEDDCSETRRPSVVRLQNKPDIADCTDQSNSLYPVSEYYRLFTTQLVNSDGSPRELIWTAIAPVSTTSKAAMGILDNGQVRNVDCPTSNQAGFRHRAMAELFDPSLSNLDSICRDSFRETLVHIAELASVSQTLEVRNLPDERMLQVSITRKAGNVDLCTMGHGITGFVRGTNGAASKLTFGDQCRRRADDLALQIKLLCAT